MDAMPAGLRLIDVAADQYEIVADDRMLVARLDGTVAVCLYDAVDEAGALLHLRFVARGAASHDLTDRTLASDLLLLDRCLSALAQALPGTARLQARLAASIETGPEPRRAADSVLSLLRACLEDWTVRIVSEDIVTGQPRRLLFRPSLGELRVADA